MRKDWGGIAASSGATGEAGKARQTAVGRKAERDQLLAMAAWYRGKGNEPEACSYERKAKAIPQ